MASKSGTIGKRAAGTDQSLSQLSGDAELLEELKMLGGSIQQRRFWTTAEDVVILRGRRQGLDARGISKLVEGRTVHAVYGRMKNLKGRA